MNHMTLVIRRYVPDDAQPTAAIFHAAVRQTGVRCYSSQQVAAWSPKMPEIAAWNARREAAWTVVAEADGRILGFCDLTSEGVLDMLFVYPDVGKQGIGSSLIQAVLEEAAARQLVRVTTNASRLARRVFERSGFVLDVENVHNRIRSVVVPNYRMHITLDGAKPQNVYYKE